MNKHDWGLVNQKYAAIKQEQTDLMAEMREDIDFYRKRIYQATKDLSKDEFAENQTTIRNAFVNYASVLIEYFKLEDIKEIMSEQLDTILEESEDDAQNHNVDIDIKSADDITKELLIRREKPSTIRIEDCFNVIKTSTQDETYSTKRHKSRPTPSPVNIRQDKFREKGVKKRQDNKKLHETA